VDGAIGDHIHGEKKSACLVHVGVSFGLTKSGKVRGGSKLPSVQAVQNRNGKTTIGEKPVKNPGSLSGQ